MVVKDLSAVVVAAGSGQRLGRGNKTLLALAEEPLLAHTMRSLRQSPSVAEIILVMNPADVLALEEQWQVSPQDLGADQVIPGGDERWQSSFQGCAASSANLPYLLVQDAARPLTSNLLLEDVAAAARSHGAAIAAEPLTDSLKQEGEPGFIGQAVARDQLWRAQTPQVARRDWLLAAFALWPQQGPAATDEACLLEAAGHAVRLVPSSSLNFKITCQVDLDIATAILQTRTSPLS